MRGTKMTWSLGGLWYWRPEMESLRHCKRGKELSMCGALTVFEIFTQSFTEYIPPWIQDFLGWIKSLRRSLLLQSQCNSTENDASKKDSTKMTHRRERREEEHQQKQPLFIFLHLFHVLKPVANHHFTLLECLSPPSTENIGCGFFEELFTLKT